MILIMVGYGIGKLLNYIFGNGNITAYDMFFICGDTVFIIFLTVTIVKSLIDNPIYITVSLR